MKHFEIIFLAFVATSCTNLTNSYYLDYGTEEAREEETIAQTTQSMTQSQEAQIVSTPSASNIADL